MFFYFSAWFVCSQQAFEDIHIFFFSGSIQSRDIEGSTQHEDNFCFFYEPSDVPGTLSSFYLHFPAQWCLAPTVVSLVLTCCLALHFLPCLYLPGFHFYRSTLSTLVCLSLFHVYFFVFCLVICSCLAWIPHFVSLNLSQCALPPLSLLTPRPVGLAVYPLFPAPGCRIALNQPFLVMVVGARREGCIEGPA